MESKMTPLAHLLVTSAGAKLMSLQGQEMLLAYGFGVLIDADHIIKLPKYFKKHNLKIVRGLRWRTVLQEPVALLWIIPLCFYLSTWVPLIFFVGHLILDYASGFLKKPFSPFSNYETWGFLNKVPGFYKELFVIILFLPINIFLR